MWGQDRGDFHTKDPAPHRNIGPGAFKVLPPSETDSSSPDPPSAAAPAHSRFSKSIRSHRNAAFAIIADSESAPNSRSTSPSGGGRVSPFRGRGFNPTGSRHASPLPSPPPPDTKSSSNISPRRSQIPRRRGSSSALFGEKITNHQVVPARRPPPSILTKQLSQSLNSIGMKPPPSPRGRKGGFRPLSPIAGSSPEPSQGTPSKIPRSRSQPPTRAPSRGTSRDPSPSKSRINYKNVKAKVNTFHVIKPKVPPKPQVPQTVNAQKKSQRKKKVKTSSSEPEKSSDSEHVPARSKSHKSTPVQSKVPSPKSLSPKTISPTNIPKSLKIDPTIQSEKMDSPEYLPDARSLSAKSVTTAMNRMNSTVLDSKTVLKDTGLSKLSPAAKAIISMSQKEEIKSNTKTSPDNKTPSNNQSNGNGKTQETPPKHTLPSVEVIRTTETASNSSGENGNGRVAERKLGISAPSGVSPQSANERIKQARTMVAADVQPIKINVKEKPSEMDVQSGNVRMAVNGVGGGSSLPPPQSPPEENAAENPPNKPSLCARIFNHCTCCKKSPKLPEMPTIPKAVKKTNWLSCCMKNKKVEEIQERINSDVNLVETEVENKLKWWEKFKCCKGNKVGDTTGCFPKRKKNWEEVKESADNVLKEPVARRVKNHCKHFFRTLFCCNRSCRCTRNRKREQEEEIARRASVLSKKKSITTTSAPPEEIKPKLDISLVEHTSQMKGAIPVLPVPLAWFCLILNVFIPGSGTVLSGFFCLCMGIPRFSQKDGIRPRIGSFIINIIIGCGQLFTVIFCLVGWGWSIWWGVTMIRLAKKYRRIKKSEEFEENPKLQTVENHLGRDIERGT